MKNFVVIGGSSGIGKALVQILASNGHSVYATFCKHVEASSGQVTYHSLDVKNSQIVLDALPNDVHGLAYCPGSINLLPFARIKPNEFIEDYELQVVGAIKVLQAVHARLKASGRGSVVLFSTVAVQHGFPFHAQVSASKGAIEGLTRALAAEWAPFVRVNAIAPSLVDTSLAGKLLNTEEKKLSTGQRHPMKRIGVPKDIAGMAAFLLSEESSWITGQVLTVDGGISTLRV